MSSGTYIHNRKAGTCRQWKPSGPDPTNVPALSNELPYAYIVIVFTLLFAFSPLASVWSLPIRVPCYSFPCSALARSAVLFD